jgi:hypothetical protein
MNDTPETDAELLARHAHVKGLVDKGMKQMERMKLGSSARMRKAQFIGTLNFTLGQCRAEIDERKLKLPRT